MALPTGLEELQSSENAIRDDEIDEIVHAATESNLMRQAIRAKQNFFDGWRRVVCVPLVQCPVLLPPRARGRCIADLLILLFSKIEPEDRIPELLNTVADVVVMLMSNLRQYIGEVLPEQGASRMCVFFPVPLHVRSNYTVSISDIEKASVFFVDQFSQKSSASDCQFLRTMFISVTGYAKRDSLQ